MNKKGIFIIAVMLLLSGVVYSQNKNTTTKSKNPTKTSVKMPIVSKIPIDSLLYILTNCKKLVINHQTEFMHIDVPASKQAMFFNMILDSVATPSPMAKNLLYYRIEAAGEQVTNGDIYFLQDRAYIVFTLSGRSYYNKITSDGMNQLKGFFKLK